MKTPYIDIHTHSRKPGSLCMVSYGLGRDNLPTLPEKPFAAGIHPWDVGTLEEDKLSGYLEYLKSAPLDAVGEVGLDYIHGGNHERQKELFLAQLEIAGFRNLPVIIHCLKAYNDLFGIVKRYPEIVFILHGYTGSIQQTRQAMDEGCYFSIGERSLKSSKTVESIMEIPAGRLFAETDESAVAIGEIYRRIAEIKNLQTADLAEQIQLNFNKIFSNTNER